MIDDDPAPRPAFTFVRLTLELTRQDDVKFAASVQVECAVVRQDMRSGRGSSILVRFIRAGEVAAFISVAASAELETSRRRYPMSLKGWAMRHPIRRIARKD